LLAGYTHLRRTRPAQPTHAQLWLLSLRDDFTPRVQEEEGALEDPGAQLQEKNRKIGGGVVSGREGEEEEACGGGRRTRVLKSVLSHVLNTWAAHALQRLKRQASMILRFCGATGSRSCATTADAIPLANAQHLQHTHAELQQSDYRSQHTQQVSRKNSTRSEQLKTPQQQRPEDLRGLLDPSPDVGAMQRAELKERDELEELSFLSDFVATHAHTPAYVGDAEDPRAPHTCRTPALREYASASSPTADYELLSILSEMRSWRPTTGWDEHVSEGEKRCGSDAASPFVLIPRTPRAIQGDSMLVLLAEAYMFVHIQSLTYKHCTMIWRPCVLICKTFPSGSDGEPDM
jgi:hypothetical protein